ncbi:hypothetical protein Cni_G01901 [Canna indica]|uniref:Uncharacterized protein n=1 Tax=Canna indica TaxID=4628 RepID=A0AAQ3JP06_9LILI|nr:hypothetical protein Cni_G01901 [Canna indica]
MLSSLTTVMRFDSKRFCRDCRRNVIREFKELKELKRVRKEPRCTRLVVGDGFMTILEGDSIIIFFEQAEEAEDADVMDKDGNELDSDDGSSFGVPDESFITPDFVDSINEPGDIERHVSPDIVDGQSSGMSFNNIKADAVEQHYDVDGNFLVKSGAASEHLKTLRRKLRSRKDNLLDQASNWYDRRPCYANHESTNQQDEVDSVCSSRGITNLHRPSRERFVKYNHRNCYQKFNDRCSQARVQDRFDYHSCGCNHQDDHIEKDGYHISMARSGKEIKTANKTECTQYMPRSSYRNVRFSNGCYFSDNFVNSKGKHVSDSPGKEILRKQVWEPLDARKKCPRSSSDSKITSTVCGVEPSKDIVFEKREDGCQEPIKFQSMDYMCLTGHSASSGKDDTVTSCKVP